MQPLLIPITDRKGNPIPEFGNPDAKFYSANDTLLATGYTRIVVGERGAYIIEHRSQDEANVKVYEQRRAVGYADYKIGMFSVAPGEVVIKS